MNGNISIGLRILGNLDTHKKLKLCALLLLMILASISEIISIGSIYPFLGALVSTEKIISMPYINHIFELLDINTKSDIILTFSLLFASAALLAGAMRFTLIMINTNLSFSIGLDISSKMFNNILHQSYESYCSRNSSELIDGLINKSSSIIYSIMNIVTFISSSIMITIILSVLILATPYIAISVFLFFTIIYLLVLLTYKNTISNNSTHMANGSSETTKILQETLGGFRDLLLECRQARVANQYDLAHNKWRRAQAQNLAISSTPRYILETAGMIFLALLAYKLTNRAEGIDNALPILGFLALSAQRLLPIIQQLYNSWVEYQSNRHSVLDALTIIESLPPLETSTTSYEPIDFKRKFEFRNVAFKYQNSSVEIFKNLNLEIRKNDFVGIYGPSGAGKSTLIDIFVGLLIPTNGKLFVDDCELSIKNLKSWRDNIAYVSQTPFLTDNSILENIAYGLEKEEISITRVEEAASKAMIASVIDNLPHKYDTKLGERGIKFSGGQKQRICIARALYKNSKVIIFDEATSALDIKTEDEIMRVINNLKNDITVILITHRPSILKQCNRVFEISNGNIIEMNSITKLS